MKKTQEITLTGEEALIAEARGHAEQAAASLRKGCEHALLAGMRLVALHKETAQEPNGYRVPRGTRLGFDEAVAQVGIPRRTAYRWMNAVAKGAMTLALAMGEEDFHEVFPEPGTARWAKWEREFAGLAAGMSLSRLLLGNMRPGTEPARLDEMIRESEEGKDAAENYLDAVEEGTMSSAQAIRALAGELATKEKEPRDPVYLDFDFATQTPVGLVPKAFVTLKNAFARWGEFDPEAREKAREVWLEVLKAAPVELTNVLKR